MMPDGWKIYAHKGKIPKAERQAHWCNIRTRFNAENVDFSDNDHKLTIYDGRYQFNIRVFFPENNEYGYGIELKSETLGYKPDERKAHQTLYYTTIARIRWEKQGVWLEGNNEIPIPKTKALRTKHRHILHKSSVRLHEKIIKNRAVPLRR
jgi:hypothetical protein